MEVVDGGGGSVVDGGSSVVMVVALAAPMCGRTWLLMALVTEQVECVPRSTVAGESAAGGAG